MDYREQTDAVSFLRWVLPGMGYRWDAFRKPHRQIIRKIRERMDLLDIHEYEEYREYLKQNQEEWAVLDRLCDVTVSQFFRNRDLWDYLRDAIFPDLIRRRAPGPIRFWSAGCCNGEEPYSVAMIVSEVFDRMKAGTETPPKGKSDSVKRRASAGKKPAGRPPCPVSILATDRNRTVLERAKRGLFPSTALSELTAGEIQDFFRPAYFEDDEDYQVNGNIRQMVEFEERDISGRLPAGLFDMVFCRNLVFTYFSRERQLEFLERLVPRLAPEGFLVLGANETIPEVSWLTSVSRTHSLYRKTGSGTPAG